MRDDSATAIRDRASRGVRRLTVAAIAGATALSAALAGLAAGSTHHAKGVRNHTVAARKTTKVTAPEPRLTPSGSTATATPSQPVQPAPQVTPSVQPPVAVTAGS
jgi:hypothetical protein